MKPKINVTQLLSIAALAFAPAASGATLVFSATNFNDINQLSTTGTLVDAAHFGADAEADVTVNGITFISRGNGSPALVLTNGTVFSDPAIYQPGTHAVGYQDIIGMSSTDEALMFGTLVFASGVGNTLVTLSGLNPLQQYQLELLVCNDRTSGRTLTLSNAAGGTTYGPYDHSNNAVQLITCTFTADSATQQFRIADSGGPNVLLNAYQLRAIPEPSTSVSLLAGCALLLGLRRRKS